MAGTLRSLTILFLIIFFPLLFLTIFLPRHRSVELDYHYPAVFNFGDSNSDTGEVTAGFGERLQPPYGVKYFKKPGGRLCDGRLVVDFLMDAMGLPFLDAYLEAIGAPSFRKGCNFAASGATILPPTKPSDNPFTFGIQVAQFLRLKAKVEDIQSQTRELDKYIPAPESFQKALYMFDIGQNDLTNAFSSKTLDQKLYKEGARNFWIHNTGPHGCFPRSIMEFGSDSSNVDKLGCVIPYNLASRSFNLQLHALFKRLQGQYPDANITYVDIFKIKSNLIANFSRYGFEQPLMACCGYGGPPLNFDSRVTCGQTKVVNGSSVTAKSFNDSKKYVNWDGVHYTEAANQYVASQILTGKFSDPPFFANKIRSLL